MSQIKMIKRGLGKHTVIYYNSDSILVLHSSNMHTVGKTAQQPKIYSDRGSNVWEKYTQVFKELFQAYSEGN